MADLQINRLARRVAQLERAQLRTKQPTLGFSSIDDGSITSVDEDQTLKMIIGRQFDGTQTTAVVSGPIPPIPSDPIVTAVIGGARIRWDGEFLADAIVPMDFSRVEVHVDDDPDFTAEFADTLVGTFETPRGGEIFAPLTAGIKYVKFVTRAQSGQPSAASFGVSVTREEIPDQVTPTDPPTMPILELTGMSRGFVLQWKNPEPGSQIAVSVNDVTNGVFLGTAVATRHSTLYFANAPDGTDFVIDVDYEFTADVTNVVGGVTNNVTGQLKLEDSNTIAALSVDKLTAGELIAPVAIVGGLTIGTILLNPDVGLVIPQPNGRTITIPADGMSPAVINAHVITDSLTVEGNANFGGTSRLLPSSILTLENGVPEPTVQVSASRHWDHVEYDMPGGGQGNLRGLTDNLAGDSWMSAFHGNFDGTASIWFLAASKIDGGTLSIKCTGSNMTFLSVHGVTRIGGSFYVLIKDFNRGQAWYVYRINATSFAKTAEYEFDFVGGNNKKAPAIGNDGTNIVLAWWADQPDGTDTIYVRRYDITSSPMVQVGSTILCELAGGGLHTATAVHYGTADFAGGASRILVTRGDTLFAFTTAGVRQTASEWIKAGSGSFNGLHWDGSRFHSLDYSGNCWEYHTNITDVSESHEITWYDNDPTDGHHETTAGPVYTFVREARSQVLIQLKPAPQAGVVGNTNAATHTRLYSGVTGGPLRLQATRASNDLQVFLDTLDTGSAEAPTVNGFDAIDASPAAIRSAGLDPTDLEPLIDLTGDGAWRLGVFAADANGVMLPNRVPFGRRFRSASDQSIPDNTDTLISWDGVVETTLMSYDSTSTVRGFVVARAGLYDIRTHLLMNGSATGRRITRILVNGNSTHTQENSVNGTNFTGLEASCVRRLSIGDTVAVQVNQTSGSARLILSGGTFTTFQMTLVGY